METVPKSPQEMAAQMRDVYPYFSDHLMPESHHTELGKRANELKAELGNMRPYTSDVELASRLTDVQARAVASGVWEPTKGEGAEERIAFAVAQRRGYGYTEEESALGAVRNLRREGYLGAIRLKRKEQEDLFENPINGYINGRTLDKETEERELKRLLERTFDMTTLTPAELTKLSQDFPSGNFVYHGAGTKQLVKIIDSGALVNAKLLREREAQVAKTEGRQAGIVNRNSGDEGISWSMNDIDALPGDRYHLAGFVGAPESVLSDTQQLAVPSRPAPNEVLQISDAVEANKFYDAKTQFELYQDSSPFSEINSVFDNLLSVSKWKKGEGNQLRDEPLLYQAKRGILAQPDYQNRLRELYDFNPDGTIRLNPDLLQQVNNEVPVAAVWLQAAIDAGHLSDTVFAGKEVAAIIDALNDNNIRDLSGKMREDWQPIADTLDTAGNMAGGVEVPVEAMYFVAPRKDAEVWLRVIARSKHWPRGILLYDDKKVRLENFASSHRGDHAELTNELRAAVSPDNGGHIDYTEVLGSKFSDDMRAGYTHQVIAERHLANRKTIKKIDGRLVVER